MVTVSGSKSRPSTRLLVAGVLDAQKDTTMNDHEKVQELLQYQGSGANHDRSAEVRVDRGRRAAVVSEARVSLRAGHGEVWCPVLRPAISKGLTPPC